MYISRVSGNDSWSCDQSNPCQTIWRAVTLASRGDHIYLDGNNTDKHPYTCKSTGTSEHPGIYVNKSLSLIGYGRPMPQIRCSKGTSLAFIGSENAEPMTVTLLGLFVNASFVFVKDSSAGIDGCNFESSQQGVQFVIDKKMVSSIQIVNSAFSRNRECISVLVNSTKDPSQSIQAKFELTNSFFDGNVLSDEGTCISFTESPYTNQPVSFDITLENVIFSRNKFSSGGLVFLEQGNGNLTIYFQNVTFTDNSASLGRGVLTGIDDSECIIRSTTLNIFINEGNFSSQYARSFNIRASNVSTQIYNSRFSGHRVEGNGGVISLRGTDLCKFNVYNSSFVNTTAAQGGAINIECAKVYSISFEDNNFSVNTAVFGGGGAVYINMFGEYAINDESSGIDNSGQNGPHLQINFVRCHFINVHCGLVYTSSGGAVSINGLKVLVKLRHTAFTNCASSWTGGGVSIGMGSTSVQRRSTGNGDVDLLLIVESSNFTECKSSMGGSLFVRSDTEMQIVINNSRFINNSVDQKGGAFALESLSTETGLLRRNISQITVECSTFRNNRAFEGGAILLYSDNPSIVIFQQVLMESNRAVDAGWGGVAAIYHLSGVKIRKSRFLNNYAGGGGGVFYIVDLHSLEVLDSLFDSNSAWGISGGAFGIEPESLSLTFTSRLAERPAENPPGSGSQSFSVVNSTFNNCSAGQIGGAIYLKHEGNLSLTFKISRFTRNQELSFGGGGALYLWLASDIQRDPGCVQTSFNPGIQNTSSVKEGPSWDYKSHLFIEETTFEKNAAGLGGAVYVINGKATFQNCSFVDNFARIEGGHIYTDGGSASLIIKGSLFKQTVKDLPLLRPFLGYSFSKSSFIHAEYSGALRLYNTTMNATPYGSTGPLILVRNGRLNVEHNKLTRFYCPIGSQMKIENFTDQIITQVNNKSCTIKVSTVELSCSACAGDSYSLQRGSLLGFQATLFQCLPCPFGSNCSQNILSKPNFWGFKEEVNPPTLKFTLCPLGYCRSPKETDFPEYNRCQGNRSGQMCGHCGESYTETLFSSNCRPSHQCRDYWFWPVAFVYVSIMALYFTFRPPILPWVKRQILWFKDHEPTNQDNSFDSGYLKILFYFYQAANLLLISNSPQHILKTKFVEPLVGLFNFQQRFSPSGLICPFPGLTVVTKQLFSASHMIGTCLMIGIFYGLHWGVQKFRRKRVPSVGLYVGGLLQTLLLGYTTLASFSFTLLRCVPIGSEKRLFYDGNVLCFQWWQKILIAFISVFFVPFVFVLLWGPFKLYNGTIAVGKFCLACCFPLPYLLYWTYLYLFSGTRNSASDREVSSPSQVSRNSVEVVLYDSFKRPGVGAKLSLSWESVMIGRRLILIVLKTFVSDPLPRLLIMSFLCFLFLVHHTLTQPFRDNIANMVETISLLFIGLLGMLNVFFASFLSLAVPLNDHFSFWWNACQAVEIAILCCLPGVFSLILVTAVFSQVCRLTVVVYRFLCHLFRVCIGWCCDRKQDHETRPLLASAS